MGHYASEMPDYDDQPASRAETGYDNKDVIHDFYAPEDPGTGSPCPRCGAKIRWHWMNVDGLLLHIKWHENLNAWVRGQNRPYPGLEI